mmetsp:Transcript_115264/g.320554  ORF Transcript_115264/g.320554 Transcript_115264/m.320554 type:complete len:296 (+) Transcript_115264:827-1714(+)
MTLRMPWTGPGPPRPRRGTRPRCPRARSCTRTRSSCAPSRVPWGRCTCPAPTAARPVPTCRKRYRRWACPCRSGRSGPCPRGQCQVRPTQPRPAPSCRARSDRTRLWTRTWPCQWGDPPGTTSQLVTAASAATPREGPAPAARSQLRGWEAEGASQPATSADQRIAPSAASPPGAAGPASPMRTHHHCPRSRPWCREQQPRPRGRRGQQQPLRQRRHPHPSWHASPPLLHPWRVKRPHPPRRRPCCSPLSLLRSLPRPQSLPPQPAQQPPRRQPRSLCRSRWQSEPLRLRHPPQS